MLCQVASFAAVAVLESWSLVGNRLGVCSWTVYFKTLLNMGRFNANLQLSGDKTTSSTPQRVTCYHQTLMTELFCSSKLFTTIGKK